MNQVHVFLDFILAKLFVAEQRRLQGRIDSLHDSNKELLRNQHLDGFMFQGKFYLHSRSPRGSGARITLHLALWDEMMDFLRDEKLIDHDKSSISQVLFRLMSTLEPQCEPQQLRDVLPDCLAALLSPELSPMERMSAMPVQGDRETRQYQKILPRIEFYAATHFIY